jgi:hypothetical protein
VSAEIYKLTAVTAPTTPVDDDLIGGLKALLEMAKTGQIQGIAYTTIQTPGAGSYTGSGTGWRGHLGGLHIVLGGIEILKARLLNEERDIS